LKGGSWERVSPPSCRALLQDAVEHGAQPVELFYCSSDPDSLDGIVLPLQQTGMVDATAPHVQDPTLPGLPRRDH
jgi:hypothetical protein